MPEDTLYVCAGCSCPEKISGLGGLSRRFALIEIVLDVAHKEDGDDGRDGAHDEGRSHMIHTGVQERVGDPVEEDGTETKSQLGVAIVGA